MPADGAGRTVGCESSKAQKTTGEAAEIIADEKLLCDLRQALAPAQERMARAPKERARVRGVPYQRFNRKTSKHALNGRA